MPRLIRGLFSRLTRRYWAPRLRRLLSRTNVTPVDLSTSQYLSSNALSGKTVLITGAASGIGKNLALAAEREGALVCYVDRDPEALRALEGLLQKGSEHRGYICDIAKTSSIEALWESLQRDNIKVDALVHCAGTRATKIHFLDTTPQLWDAAFAANVLGPVFLTQLVTRSMKEGGRLGAVLFISSVHREITGGWPQYSSTKAALDMVIKELALDLACYGIRVNAIAPGWTAEPNEPGADYFEHAPLGECAIPPSFISKACIFLISNYQSAYTTGACLTIDAGVSLRSYRTPARPPEGDVHTRWPLSSDSGQQQGSKR